MATRLDVLDLRARDHQNLECHAAYVERNGTIVYACTKPATHTGAGATGQAKEKAPREGPEQAKARIEREQLKAAAEARMVVLREAVKGRGPTAKQTTELSHRALLGVLCSFDYYSSNEEDVALEILGLTPTDKNADTRKILAGLAAAKPRPYMAAVAAFAMFEARASHSYREWDDDDAWYVELLELEFGYDLTEIEHTRLGHVLKGGVWTRPKAAP